MPSQFFGLMIGYSGLTAAQASQAPDPQPGGSTDTSERLQPSSAAVSTASSEQAAFFSLPRMRESSYASLLLLFKSHPLRWAVI